MPPPGSATASWVSSNAKARERAGSGGLFARGKGKKSAFALGAAGKMRAEASPGVLPLLQGFVPGPVTDMLEVRVRVRASRLKMKTHRL